MNLNFGGLGDINPTSKKGLRPYGIYLVQLKSVEVKEGQGVVESAIIEPAGIASQDKKAILLANEKGKSLIDALQELALNHRLNNIK